jgi:hypothetical protein
MKRCASPDHPHCTTWVMPGESACAHGHAQPAPAVEDALGDSFDMISRLRAGRNAGEAIRTKHVEVPAAGPSVFPAAAPAAAPSSPGRTHLHVSGYDPRAAGGRHAVKLELRGMPIDAPARLDLLLQSDLLPGRGVRQQFMRGLHGEWRPVFLEFSSRGREHGQYRIDVLLQAGAEAEAANGLQAGAARTWAATLVLLVPRPDASLGEIHQTFLSTHKNVRISADDASIARLHGLAPGPMDIDIQARNASIAQLHFDAAGGAGKIDLGLPTLAWDEDLIEIGLPRQDPAVHPCPATSACLVYAEPDAGFPRHVRLFALEECVIGRFEGAGIEAEADLLLQHHGEDGPHAAGLTRRLSARHAVIRAGRQGFEIEDVSRYGLLLDGVWPGKHKPVPLRLGMRIELTASIKGVAALVVTALCAQGVVLHRVDGGGAFECFMLLAPGRAVERPLERPAALPRAAAMPQLFHRDGGFWHLDPASGHETPLSPATLLARLPGFGSRVRFSASAHPEDPRARSSTERRGGERRGEGRAKARAIPPARLLDA